MLFKNEYVEALKAGKIEKQKKCPVCGNPLKVVIFGYLTEEMGEFIKKNKKFLIDGGCMCFMDDRDPTFVCPKCHGEFMENLERIKLIPCPLEASNAIREDECRKYELLENREHYELLENREVICDMICPFIGKQVRITTKRGDTIEGKLGRTFRYTVSTPGNHVIVFKERDKYHSDVIDVYISDIVSIDPT